MVLLRQPKIFIPNLLARWPWPRRINPHYHMVGKDSAAWIANFGAFNHKAQLAFERCNFTLLGCLACPLASKEHARTSCDLIQLCFVIDEYSDVSTPSEVQQQKDIVMDALHNPHKPRPKGEWIGGEITRQFWELALRSASAQSQKRFIQPFEGFLEGIVQQAIDRSDHRIHDIKDYLELRRETGAVKPAFALLELDLDIPDGVFSHPAFQEMLSAVVDMVIIENDLLSYNKELSRGEESHNLITIVMNEIGTDVNGAILWGQDMHIKLEKRFHTAMAALPGWDEPLNSQVKAYCDRLGSLVRGGHDWHYESGRYFGTKGLEIKERGWMSLMPKLKSVDSLSVGPVLVDSSLL